MIMLTLLALAAAANQAAPPPWAAFSRGGELSHVVEKVTIASERVTSGRFDYRLTYTRQTLKGNETRVTDSAMCPAVRPLIASMRDLTMPRPMPFGVDDANRPMVLDGTDYALHVPSNFTNGDLTITANVDSPLATWVDAAFKALEGCWRPAS